MNRRTSAVSAAVLRGGDAPEDGGPPRFRPPRPARPAFAQLALVVAGVVFAAFALAGCSVGGGDRDTGGKPVKITVTRDFGNRLGAAEFDELPAGPTVMRLLQKSFAVETSYGGRFVTTIDGLGQMHNPERDWIYYVNGREAEVGAAALRVSPGDRVQWDLHRWDGMPIGKAIVGAYPQPLLNAGAHVACLRAGEKSCAAAEERLAAAGVHPATELAGVPVVVGEVPDLAGNKVRIRFGKQGGLPDLERPPAESGLFVRVHGDELELFSEAAERRGKLGPGQGVVFATADDDGPVWFVLGADKAGVAAAVELLDERVLADQFAVYATAGGGVSDLPMGPGV